MIPRKGSSVDIDLDEIDVSRFEEIATVREWTADEARAFGRNVLGFPNDALDSAPIVKSSRGTTWRILKDPKGEFRFADGHEAVLLVDSDQPARNSKMLVSEWAEYADKIGEDGMIVLDRGTGERLSLSCTHDLWADGLEYESPDEFERAQEDHSRFNIFDALEKILGIDSDADDSVDLLELDEKIDDKNEELNSILDAEADAETIEELETLYLEEERVREELETLEETEDDMLM